MFGTTQGIGLSVGLVILISLAVSNYHILIFSQCRNCIICSKTNVYA